jgi:hypothetical protein
MKADIIRHDYTLIDDLDAIFEKDIIWGVVNRYMQLRKIPPEEKSVYYLVVDNTGSLIWQVYHNRPISGTITDMISVRDDVRALYTTYFYKTYAYFHDGDMYEVYSIDSSLTFEADVAYNLKRDESITIHQIVMMGLV